MRRDRCLPPTHSPPDRPGVVLSELVQHIGQRGPGIRGTEGGVDEHPGYLLVGLSGSVVQIEGRRFLSDRAEGWLWRRDWG